MFTPGSEVRWWLLWAGLLYGAAGRLRASFYRWGWLAQRKLPVPVISIGNLTVGGTGKTPVVIKLAEWLLAEGKRVAILSRGYRRVGRESMFLVSDGTRLLAGAAEAGDEPYLIACRCPQAIVAVGANRYELGCWLLNRFQVDCILLDDGFQHLALCRDADLLLVDATDLNGLNAVFPAGRLREPIGAAARASMVVVTRAGVPRQVDQVVSRLREAGLKSPAVAQAVFQAEGLVSVTTTVRHPPQWCPGKTVLLCSGIAHTASFRATAESLGLRILDEMMYPDHHRYTKEDVEELRIRAAAAKAELIVTTEKDAGKLAPLLTPADGEWWAVRLATEIIAGEQQLRQEILQPAGRTPMEVCA